jgi:lysophospholipid acyltransferase
MDSASIASGLAYNGEDETSMCIILFIFIEKPKFDLVKSVSTWHNTFGYDIKFLYSYWNMMITAWLKNYVFLRVIRSTKDGSSGFVPALVTFMVSAIWHGFYPGYFMFFIMSAIVDNMYKEA